MTVPVPRVVLDGKGITLFLNNRVAERGVDEMGYRHRAAKTDDRCRCLCLLSAYYGSRRPIKARSTPNRATLKYGLLELRI